MKNPQLMKLFLVVILSTLYIYSFTNYGALAFEKIVKDDEVFQANTSIAHVDVSGKTKQEAMELLLAAQEEWVQQTEIKISYKEKQEYFDVAKFHFLMEETLNQVAVGRENALIVQVSQNELEELQQFVGTKTSLDIFSLENTLTLFPAMLEVGKHTVKLDDFLTDPPGKDVVLAEATVHNSQQLQHLQRWVEQFPEIEISPKQPFSLLKLLEERGEKAYPAQTLSTVATAMYQTLLPTNLMIAERHISRELPGYVTEGLEVKVDSRRGLDFMVMNPNDQSYLLESSIKSDAFHVKLKGQTFLYEYKIKFEDKEIVPRKTIIRYDPLLNSGQSRVAELGKDGLLIKVFREIVDEQGSFLEKELISEDFYPPVHRIEVRSLLEKEKEEEEQLDEDDTEKKQEEENGENGCNSPDEDEEKDKNNGEEEPPVKDNGEKQNATPANKRAEDEEG